MTPSRRLLPDRPCPQDAPEVSPTPRDTLAPASRCRRYGQISSSSPCRACSPTGPQLRAPPRTPAPRHPGHRDEIDRQQTRLLFNLVTVITLFIGITTSTPRCSCSSMSLRRSCSHRSRCAPSSDTSTMPSASPWPATGRGLRGPRCGPGCPSFPVLVHEADSHGTLTGRRRHPIESVLQKALGRAFPLQGRGVEG